MNREETIRKVTARIMLDPEKRRVFNHQINTMNQKVCDVCNDEDKIQEVVSYDKFIGAYARKVDREILKGRSLASMFSPLLPLLKMAIALKSVAAHEQNIEKE